MPVRCRFGAGSVPVRCRSAVRREVRREVSPKWPPRAPQNEPKNVLATIFEKNMKNEPQINKFSQTFLIRVTLDPNVSFPHPGIIFVLIMHIHANISSSNLVCEDDTGHEEIAAEDAGASI